jgi:hypothetical protein
VKRRRQHAASAGETDPIRRLIDKQITVDEYVKHLDERVRERREAEEQPPRQDGTPSQDSPAES